MNRNFESIQPISTTCEIMCSITKTIRRKYEKRRLPGSANNRWVSLIIRVLETAILFLLSQPTIHKRFSDVQLVSSHTTRRNHHQTVQKVSSPTQNLAQKRAPPAANPLSPLCCCTFLISFQSQFTREEVDSYCIIHFIVFS